MCRILTFSDFTSVVVLVALLSAFCILLMKKWGVMEYMQVHGDKYISKMFSCGFCLSFWTASVLFIGVACVYDNPLLLLCGMFTAPITRMLV